MRNFSDERSFEHDITRENVTLFTDFFSATDLDDLAAKDLRHDRNGDVVNGADFVAPEATPLAVFFAVNIISTHRV